MPRLPEKVVVITGAAGALGAGVARRFAREGARIHLLDAAGLAPFAAEIGACAHVIDVRNKAALQREIGRIGAEAGRIDILVNAAHQVAPWRRLEDMPDAAFEDAFTVCFYSALWAMQATLPFMRDTGEGRIINFGSVYGDNVSDLIGDYNAATEALRALTRTAAAEWGRFKIRVNLLVPTLSDDAFQAYAQTHADDIAEALSLVALGRFGDPEHDIGGAALFLASELGGYVTGNVIHADGGYHIAGPAYVPRFD